MNALRKEQKQKEAIERNEKWAALSFQAQLDYLDGMFGKDKGAAKQRAKIQLKMVGDVPDPDADVPTTKAKRKRTRKKK